MPRDRLDRYGPHRSQVAELWAPGGKPPAAGWPVAVVVHGGFWRARYTRRLMNGICADLAARGIAAWNLEYRRVGGRSGGGWPQTFDDAAAGMARLETVAAEVPLDLTRVVTVGHSAGGHLALWLAAARRPYADGSDGPHRGGVRAVAAIGLGAVSDLAAAARGDLGAGATLALMGGGPDEHPERYAAGSPAELLPLGVPQVLVHGTDDESVPFSMSEQYAERARQAGDDVRLVVLDGVGHMPLVRSRTRAWEAVRSEVEQLVGVHP